MPNGVVENPLVFVSIADDGIVTITCHRAEMGQGVRTGVPMILADEMEADWSKVRVVQAPGDEVRYGNQDTDGSRTTRHFFMPMRRCGAAARQMLEGAAAARWGVPVAEVSAKNHQLMHTPSGRTLGFGEVAADAAKLPVPASADLQAEEAGRVPLHRQGQDADRRRLRHDHRQGRLRHRRGACPTCCSRWSRAPRSTAARLRGFDAAEAMKVPGVVKVVEIKGSPMPSAFQPLPGVAVIATSTWAAMNGRKALKLDWEGGPNGSYSSDSYRAAMEAAAGKPGKVIRNTGDVDAAMKSAAKALKARVLHAAPDAGADGAAGRDRAHQGRHAARCGARSRARRRCATTSPSGSS